MKTNGVTIRPSLMHSVGSWNRIEKFRAIRPERKAPACIGESSPVVKGLALVLSTCLSMSLSVKSLIIHPALRHDRAPTVKRPRVYILGITVGELRAMPK